MSSKSETNKSESTDLGRAKPATKVTTRKGDAKAAQTASSTSASESSTELMKNSEEGENENEIENVESDVKQLSKIKPKSKVFERAQEPDTDEEEINNRMKEVYDLDLEITRTKKCLEVYPEIIDFPEAWGRLSHFYDISRPGALWMTKYVAIRDHPNTNNDATLREHARDMVERVKEVHTYMKELLSGLVATLKLRNLLREKPFRWIHDHMEINRLASYDPFRYGVLENFFDGGVPCGPELPEKGAPARKRSKSQNLSSATTVTEDYTGHKSGYETGSTTNSRNPPSDRRLSGESRRESFQSVNTLDDSRYTQTIISVGQHQPPPVLKEVSFAAMNEFREAVTRARMSMPQFNRGQYISKPIRIVINTALEERARNEGTEYHRYSFDQYSDDDFFEAVLPIFHPMGMGGDPVERLRTLMGAVRLNLTLDNPIGAATFAYDLQMALVHSGYLYDEEEEENEDTVPKHIKDPIIKTVIDNISQGGPPGLDRYLMELRDRLRKVPRPDTFALVAAHVASEVLSLRALYEFEQRFPTGAAPAASRLFSPAVMAAGPGLTLAADAYPASHYMAPALYQAYSSSAPPPTHVAGWGHSVPYGQSYPAPAAQIMPPSAALPAPAPQHARSGAAQVAASKEQMSDCEGCGRRHQGTIQTCKLRAHPNFNFSDQPWASSVWGMRLAAMNHRVLPWNARMTDDLKSTTYWRAPESRHPKRYSNQRSDRTPHGGAGATNPQGTQLYSCHVCKMDAVLHRISSHKCAYISPNFAAPVNRLAFVKCDVLVDTGASAGSFCTEQIARALEGMGASTDTTVTPINVCSCYRECRMTGRVVLAKLHFRHRVTKSIFIFPIRLTVLNGINIDVVIGLRDLRSHNGFLMTHIMNESQIDRKCRVFEKLK